MNQEDVVEVTSRVPRRLFTAFTQMVSEFFAQSHGGETSGQRAEEVRARDRDTGLDSLVHLARLAEGDTGQCGIIARFLAGLYNGTAFPFDLTGRGRSSRREYGPESRPLVHSPLGVGRLRRARQGDQCFVLPCHGAIRPTPQFPAKSSPLLRFR
jgi:hypothetical protein